MDRKLGSLINEKAALEQALKKARCRARLMADELRRTADALEGQRSWARLEGGDLSLGTPHVIDQFHVCAFPTKAETLEALEEVQQLSKRPTRN